MSKKMLINDLNLATANFIRGELNMEGIRKEDVIVDKAIYNNTRIVYRLRKRAVILSDQALACLLEDNPSRFFGYSRDNYSIEFYTD